MNFISSPAVHFLHVWRVTTTDLSHAHLKTRQHQHSTTTNQLTGLQAPLYLHNSTGRSLRSADVSTCVVLPTLSSYGDRTFAAAGPRLWNCLPVQLHSPDITYGLFRRQLKGHLFREALTRRSVTSGKRRHRTTLTYLLADTASPTADWRIHWSEYLQNLTMQPVQSVTLDDVTCINDKQNADRQASSHNSPSGQAVVSWPVMYRAHVSHRSHLQSYPTASTLSQHCQPVSQHLILLKS